MFKRWEEMKELHDPVTRARRLAEQRAIKVHTVYKVDGKVVGIVYRNGWTMFASNGAGQARTCPPASGVVTGVRSANGASSIRRH